MIKTWMIPIVVSTIIMVSLLIVNLTVQSGSILLVGFLKQRARLLLADSLAKDIFNSVENIAEVSMGSSRGNFSEFKKNLMDKMERFKTENLHEECFKEFEIIVQFDYTIETREEEFSVEIACRLRVSDSEGFFVFERVHNTVKRQDSTG